MKILIVDDDPLIQEAVGLWLRNKYTLVPALSVDAAIQVIENQEIDGALVDMDLGDRSGLEFLQVARQRLPDLPILMISGHNATPVVVKCIQHGADDFLEKPFDGESLLLRLTKVFSDTRKNRVFRRAFEISNTKNKIIGTSPLLDRARSLVERAGRMRILFHGETGVGKTPFAWYSNQVVSGEDGCPRPFEQINCAGLNKEHFQDQLFGHKKGAFTGAIGDKRGLVEIAKGGDLFLDEIGEMPLDTQALFLTFIDTQEYYRLGDDQKRRADVRILCATNRDLKQMVAEGTFRKDLYSRISQVVVDIPALRDRPQDIPALFESFILQFSGHRKPYSDAVLQLMLRHTWEEGNVRELRDIVEYLCIMGRDSDRLDVEHVADRILPSATTVSALAPAESSSDAWIEIAETHGLDHCLSAVEKTVLEHYFRKCDGAVDEMARLLGTSSPTLYRRLKRYQISSRDDSRFLSTTHYSTPSPEMN